MNYENFLTPFEILFATKQEQINDIRIYILKECCRTKHILKEIGIDIEIKSDYGNLEGEKLSTIRIVRAISNNKIKLKIIDFLLGVI